MYLQPSLVTGLDVECDFRTWDGAKVYPKEYLRGGKRFEKIVQLGGSVHFDRDDYEISSFPVLYSLRDVPCCKLSQKLNHILYLIEVDFYRVSEVLSSLCGKEVLAIPNNIHLSKNSNGMEQNRNYQGLGVIERGFVVERVAYDQITRSRVPNVRTSRTKFRKEILTVYRLDKHVSVGPEAVQDLEYDLLLCMDHKDDPVLTQIWREYQQLKEQEVIQCSYRQAWLNLAMTTLEFIEQQGWDIDWNTVTSLKKINKITVGGWDVPVHGNQSYRDLLRWLLSHKALQWGLFKNGPLEDYLLIHGVASGSIAHSPYRTNDIIHLEGELPVVEDMMIHALDQQYIDQISGVEVESSIPTDLDAFTIEFKTEPSSISAGIGTKYAVVFQERTAHGKGQQRVVPLHQVEAIQKAIEIGKSYSGVSPNITEAFFTDKAFAALFGMENFQCTPIQRGTVITYEKAHKRHLAYHTSKIRRKQLQQLLSLLDREQIRRQEYQETIACELLHVKKHNLFLEGAGLFLNHYRYSFKPNYDSLIGIIMLFSIGTMLLLLSLTMDYRQLSDFAFHNELKKSILPFGIIPGIIFEIGAFVYTWFTSKTTYQEMKLLSCYSSRVFSHTADAFEIILDNKEHKGYRLFKGLSVGICIDKELTPLQKEFLRVLDLEGFSWDNVSTQTAA
jgi:hypothetical protein